MNVFRSILSQHRAGLRHLHWRYEHTMWEFRVYSLASGNSQQSWTLKYSFIFIANDLLSVDHFLVARNAIAMLEYFESNKISYFFIRSLRISSGVARGSGPLYDFEK